jgi:hypothetical protein
MEVAPIPLCGLLWPLDWERLNAASRLPHGGSPSKWCMAANTDGEGNMTNIHRIARRGLLALGTMLVIGLSTASQAGTGVVRFDVGKAGFIVGVGGGSGTLSYNGRVYPLSVSGMSFGATIGASKTQLIGHAYNLNQPSDIIGTYSAVGTGIAVAGGAGQVQLKNEKGVILALRGRKVGFEFAANISGVQITMR